jgi:hypothetical protein
MEYMVLHIALTAIILELGIIAVKLTRMLDVLTEMSDRFYKMNIDIVRLDEIMGAK